MKKVLFAVVLVLAIALLLPADVYIKTNVHTDAFAMMGQNQPAKDEVMEQWVGNNQLANKTGDKIMIMDMNKNLMFIVNPKDKSYVQTTLPLDMTKLVPKEAASMMAMMKVTVKVTPNGQTKKIGKWNCTGYDMDMNMMMMQMKMKVWATTEVPFDWKLFSKMYANVSKMQFMDDAAIAETHEDQRLPGGFGNEHGHDGQQAQCDQPGGGDHAEARPGRHLRRSRRLHQERHPFPAGHARRQVVFRFNFIDKRAVEKPPFFFDHVKNKLNPRPLLLGREGELRQEVPLSCEERGWGELKCSARMPLYSPMLFRIFFKA